MKIILTGASGFLGRNICSVIGRKSILTLGRTEADILCDLSKECPVLEYADIVIHAAGKAHVVPKTEEQKQDFFDVNVTGTLNLLKALEVNRPRCFVLISSVAVYGRESGILINESAELLASDPYGRSKAEAEKIVTAWCAAHGVVCTIFRLPLLVGVEPPGNLGAMINGIKKGFYVNIGGGRARKSMVLAEDVSEIIPTASEKGGVYNLTDGDHPAFGALSAKIASELRKASPLTIPFGMATILARLGDLLGQRSPINSRKLKKITSDLTFDDSKARRELGWAPRKVIENFILK